MNEEILDNVNRRLDDALERGREMVENDELPQQVEELKGRAEGIIREHPIKSVAVGLFAGYVIGKILSSDK
ncbi:hypothetical protein [Fodinibius salsisoli]|uniref:Membrane-anchored ribosome-binding protein, inhibits growth in stationary phase, ElaB/YqjD/DUF883 family n=1 Tax=Fodinibius salsisoli TaxID=2820877 RepID=A0ABT3PNA1_9BACT|nr:hypothetical protein [Fodinibius salsisoli]MCW9707243.1 hypothetical protein [Fodinibius salsisoli]